MHLAVDDAGQDVQALGVERLGGLGRTELPERGDAPVLDAEVAHARAVVIDDRGARDEQIVRFGHLILASRLRGSLPCLYPWPRIRNLLAQFNRPHGSMSNAFIAHLADRGVVAVTGADAVKFLNGLVTNEVAHLNAGEAAHAALLSPQGKILFDFLCVRTPDGFLLDCHAPKSAELVKRLSMYKLRAAIGIKDVSEQFSVLALWGNDS